MNGLKAVLSTLLFIVAAPGGCAHCHGGGGGDDAGASDAGSGGDAGTTDAGSGGAPDSGGSSDGGAAQASLDPTIVTTLAGAAAFLIEGPE